MAGRPNILTDELLALAEDYLESTTSVGVNTLLPTIEGLAMYINVARSTMYKWETENAAFSDILERLREAQAEKIIQNSMVNRYNPTISKLMLSKHGYIEKRETDITSGGEKLEAGVNADQLDQLIKARAGRADISGSSD